MVAWKDALPWHAVLPRFPVPCRRHLATGPRLFELEQPRFSGHARLEMLSNKPYDGPLTRGKMPDVAQRAYWVICDQRARCSNPRHSHYASYGGRGIRVEYSAKEFVRWYTQNVAKGMHVGRIDHEKNYSFDNLVVQTGRENSLEVYDRIHRHKWSKLTPELVAEIRAKLAEAEKGAQTRIAKEYGVSDATISYIKSGKIW